MPPNNTTSSNQMSKIDEILSKIPHGDRVAKVIESRKARIYTNEDKITTRQMLNH